MKTLVKLLFVIAFLGMLTNCAKDEIIDEGANELKSAIPPTVNKAQGLDQDRFVMIDELNLKVHYRIIGKGPVDIVFIPGWTNPLTVYTKQFDYFREKARCIYIDLPGHGLSDAPENIEYTMGLMADAIYTVVKKEGLHKFAAVGFSWGSSPLTQFEIRHPGMITQLILLDIGIPTWPPLTDASRNATYEANLNMTPGNKSVALNGLIPQVTAPEDLKEWGNYFLDFPNWLLANMYYHYQAKEVCQPYQWTVPVNVIYRIMAPNSPKETRTKLFFPNCAISVIGGDQHCIQWAYPETVNQMMSDFLIDRPGKKY